MSIVIAVEFQCVPLYYATRRLVEVFYFLLVLHENVFLLLTVVVVEIWMAWL